MLICWIVIRRGKLRYRLRTLFLLTLLAAGLLAVLQPDASDFGKFPFDLAVPAADWEGVQSVVIHSWLNVQGREWLWPIFQWLAYHGPEISVGLWLVIAVLWMAWGAKRAHHEDRSVSAAVDFPRSVGSGAVILAFALLLYYLAVMPTVIQHAQADYDRAAAFATSPGAYWRDLDAILGEVRDEQPKDPA